MAFLGVKLTDEEKKKLDELAEHRGMTVSDLIRTMIRNDHDRRSVVEALQEVKTIVGNLAARQGRGIDKDTAEILRIVTLMAKAMPAVARQLQ